MENRVLSTWLLLCTENPTLLTKPRKQFRAHMRLTPQLKHRLLWWNMNSRGLSYPPLWYILMTIYFSSLDRRSQSLLPPLTAGRAQCDVRKIDQHHSSLRLLTCRDQVLDVGDNTVWNSSCCPCIVCSIFVGQLWPPWASIALSWGALSSSFSHVCAQLWILFAFVVHVMVGIMNRETLRCYFRHILGSKVTVVGAAVSATVKTSLLSFLKAQRIRVQLIMQRYVYYLKSQLYVKWLKWP